MKKAAMITVDWKTEEFQFTVVGDEVDDPVGKVQTMVDSAQDENHDLEYYVIASGVAEMYRMMLDSQELIDGLEKWKGSTKD
jgi:hypothetical protein